ncbi:MAG: hypothetical protein KGZ93_07490 [Actinobacteria bacterium]|nr:hypothetical protein [Actinomycetota bacterium]
MGKEKILVVDDEPKILKVIEHSLRNEGFHILKASDGAEALSRSLKSNFFRQYCYRFVRFV